MGGAIDGKAISGAGGVGDGKGIANTGAGGTGAGGTGAGGTGAGGTGAGGTGIVNTEERGSGGGGDAAAGIEKTGAGGGALNTGSTGAEKGGAGGAVGGAGTGGAGGGGAHAGEAGGATVGGGGAIGGGGGGGAQAGGGGSGEVSCTGGGGGGGGGAALTVGKKSGGGGGGGAGVSPDWAGSNGEGPKGSAGRSSSDMFVKCSFFLRSQGLTLDRTPRLRHATTRNDRGGRCEPWHDRSRFRAQIDAQHEHAIVEGRGRVAQHREILKVELRLTQKQRALLATNGRELAPLHRGCSLAESFDHCVEIKSVGHSPTLRAHDADASYSSHGASLGRGRGSGRGFGRSSSRSSALGKNRAANPSRGDTAASLSGSLLALATSNASVVPTKLAAIASSSRCEARCAFARASRTRRRGLVCHA